MKKCCENCKRLEDWDFQKGVFENDKFRKEILGIKGCSYREYIVVQPEKSKCKHFKKKKAILTKYKIIEKENTYLVRGIYVTFTEKLKYDKAGKEIYDPELEQENDLKLYQKHKEIILEKLEKGVPINEI